MENNEEFVAYRLVAKNKRGQVVSTQLVAPKSVRYAAKLLMEEGFEVEETPLTEMPADTELDVR